jgi:hypothetical protein
MLLDREQQAAALEAAYRECGQGRGAVAVIRGPVGSGKTVLLQAFTGRSAAAGATVLGAVASRAEHGLPLGVIGQLFRCPLPAAIASQAAELIGSRPLDGQRGPADQACVSPVLARVCEGLFGLLTVLSGDGPVVLAVDGMQYADVASLQCLSYLARRAAILPILTVLTECTCTLPADRLLHAELLRQGNCHSVPVGQRGRPADRSSRDQGRAAPGAGLPRHDRGQPAARDRDSAGRQDGRRARPRPGVPLGCRHLPAPV